MHATLDNILLQPLPGETTRVEAARERDEDAYRERIDLSLLASAHNDPGALGEVFQAYEHALSCVRAGQLADAAAHLLKHANTVSEWMGKARRDAWK